VKIKCPQCDTTYDVSNEIASSGAQVQCAKCTNIFTATPVSEPEIVLDPLPEPAPEPINDLLSEEEKDFFASFGVKTADEPPAKPVDELDTDPVSMEEEEGPPISDTPAYDEAMDDISWSESDAAPIPEDTDQSAEFDEFDAAPLDDDSDLFADTDLQTAVVSEPESVFEDLMESEPAPVPAPNEDLLENEDEAPNQRFTPQVLIGWGVLAASVAMVFTGATLFRVPIVKALPGMAELYAKVGLPVNIRGLEFYGLSHQWVNKGGRMRLVVRGEIANITDDAVPIPEIVFAMVDSSGLEFFQWTERTITKQLKPGAKTRFRAQIPAPADRVQQLKIRFAKR
jgi:predicted Zn finger-like uncharacterized protein